MPDLTNEKTVVIYKRHHECISNKYVCIFGNLEQLSQWFLGWSYNQHIISASCFVLEESVIQE